jgi:hypothetical protein
MVMLYRSPSIIVENYEWHLCTRVDYGHVVTKYYFRPLSLVRYRWMPITSWKGHKPKSLRKVFQAHLHHARTAEDNFRRRSEIISERLKVAA